MIIQLSSLNTLGMGKIILYLTGNFLIIVLNMIDNRTSYVPDSGKNLLKCYRKTRLNDTIMFKKYVISYGFPLDRN